VELIYAGIGVVIGVCVSGLYYGSVAVRCHRVVSHAKQELARMEEELAVLQRHSDEIGEELARLRRLLHTCAGRTTGSTSGTLPALRGCEGASLSGPSAGGGDGGVRDDARHTE